MAIESNVDVLITGDKDFGEIIIDRPMIMTPRNFIDKFMN
jgi:predicted nucleic acid-binding protein